MQTENTLFQSLRKQWRLWLMAAAALLISMGADAQNSRLFTPDGDLNSSMVNQVMQDADGMVWVSTEDGLHRYDGVKFNLYLANADNEHALANSYVNFVFCDNEDHLLVGTKAGLQLYRPSTDDFSEPARMDGDEQPFSLSMEYILQRRNGDIVVSGVATTVVALQDGELTLSDLHPDLRNIQTGCMAEDKDGNLWVAAGDRGIARVDSRGEVRWYDTGGDINIRAMMVDTLSRQLYVGSSQRGLLVYDAATDRLVAAPGTEGENLAVRAIHPMPDHSLLIGTDGEGLKRYYPATCLTEQVPFDAYYFSSANAKVHSLLIDAEDNLWLALYQRGVMVAPLRQNHFDYVGFKSSVHNVIGSNCVTAIAEDNADQVWVATDGDGIYALQSQTFSCTAHLPVGSMPASIVTLYRDRGGNLWVGSYGEGGGRINTSTGRMEPLRLTDRHGNPAMNIYGFAEDADGRLWVATMGSGLFYRQDGEWHRVEEFGGFVNNWMGCIAATRSGLIMAGTYDGAVLIQPRHPEADPQKILEGKVVYCLAQDSKGDIFLGCSDGLYQVDGKTHAIRHFTTADGLPSPTIYAIQPTAGGLWITTNHGMARYDAETGRFSNYYAADGLQGNEFSKNASLLDSNGRLWFGGTGGVTIFAPEGIRHFDRKWHVRLTGFYLFGKPVHAGDKSGDKVIVDQPVWRADHFFLSHADNSFSLEFSTTELAASERLAYQYRVNDGPWTTLPHGDRRVALNNMHPGSYRFDLRVVDGSEESDPRTVFVSIAPPWYNTWWAWLLYTMLALLALAYVWHRWRERLRLRREREEREREERENEAKIQFFINLSHELRTPMSLIVSPLKRLIRTDGNAQRQRSYRIIHRNADRILQLVNQIMDVRKIEKGQLHLRMRPLDMVDFVNQLMEVFEDYAEENHIALTFEHDGLSRLDVWLDGAYFDKVVVNILSNAFKHTPPGGAIDIRLCATESLAMLSFTDTGTGIPAAERERIFGRFYQVSSSLSPQTGGTGIGLHLVRQLVELHHGSIAVDDNPEGEGSRFTVCLPLGEAHLREDEKAPQEETVNAPGMPLKDEITSVDATEEVATEEEAAEPTPHQKSKYRLLIVDDEPDVRRYVSEEMSDRYHVVECVNGKEALDAVFRQQPDLVVTDVMMPVMDGIELCRKIKQNPNLNHIPVVMLTAKTRDEDNVEGMNVGADAYVTKPFSIDVLKSTVQSIIRQRERLRNTFQEKQLPDEQIDELRVKSPDEKLMERVQRSITSHISDPQLAVNTICEEVGISRVHLHRKLKELTNQTTRDYIRNVRLQQAAMLLKQKNYAISEVATLVGFTNAANFSTAFRALYGMSPSQYAAEHSD